MPDPEDTGPENAGAEVEAGEGGAGPRPLVVHSETLDYSADCAEFCPVPGLTHLLALGTYQLLEEQQIRVGKCYLCCLGQGDAADGGGEGSAPSGCVRASDMDMPGIFDLKWRPALGGSSGGSGSSGSGQAVLGAALADGTVRLLEVVTEDEGARDTRYGLREQAQVAACSEGMSLSLDWQACTGSGATKIASSSSSGTVSLLQATEAGLALLSEWNAHSLEVWCTAFHRSEEHLLFSGADDCYFKAFDTRSDPASPVFSDRRTHTAGVCTVSPHPSQHHLVATGSYDENVRLWDLRNVAKPVVQSQLNTGGGNWRLRWHPYDQQVMLAACMYNGFAVLRADDGFGALDLVARYQHPNKHIAYGADWWQQPTCCSAPAAATTTATTAAAASYTPDPDETASASAKSAAALSNINSNNTNHSSISSKGEAGNSRERCSSQPGWALAATCSFYDRHHTLVWLPTL